MTHNCDAPWNKSLEVSGASTVLVLDNILLVFILFSVDLNIYVLSLHV